MGFKQKREKTSAAAEHFLHIRCVLPRSLHNAVMAKSHELGVPPSFIIAYAVDKELTEGEPFEYPCEMPASVFIEDAYNEEAVKIYQFIRKFGPMSIEMIMASRRDFGVLNKTTVMLAIRELFNKNVFVELLYPSWIKWFKFGQQVKFVTPKTLDHEKKEKERAELKKRLAQLDGEE